MTSEAKDPSTPRGHAEPEPLDRWVVLQRSVAVGLIATFALVMVALVGTVMPPLAVASVLFAIPLVASWWRPRGSAVAIGVLAALWLVSQVANASQVAPSLATPSAADEFVTTVAMIVVPAAGTVGLVGLLRGLSGTVAMRVLLGAGVLVGSAALVGAVASLVGD